MQNKHVRAHGRRCVPIEEPPAATAQVEARYTGPQGPSGDASRKGASCGLGLRSCLSPALRSAARGWRIPKGIEPEASGKERKTQQVRAQPDNRRPAAAEASASASPVGPVDAAGPRGTCVRSRGSNRDQFSTACAVWAAHLQSRGQTCPRDHEGAHDEYQPPSTPATRA